MDLTSKMRYTKTIQFFSEPSNNNRDGGQECHCSSVRMLSMCEKNSKLQMNNSWNYTCYYYYLRRHAVSCIFISTASRNNYACSRRYRQYTSI